MQRWGKSADISPLYTTKDAEAVAPIIKTKKYNEMFSLRCRTKVIFQDAGRILGAAIVEIFITENGATMPVFSEISINDISCYGRSRGHGGEADYLFMESTYGDRNHKGEEDSLMNCRSDDYSYSRGKRLLFPPLLWKDARNALFTVSSEP